MSLGHPPESGARSPLVSEGSDVHWLDTLVELEELRAENQILHGECERMQRLLQSASDYAVITINERNDITGWLAGSENVFGYTESAMLGQPLKTLIAEEYRADLAFFLELCRTRRSGRTPIEGWHVRRDGLCFWARGALLPLQDGNAQASCFTVLLRDGSAARQAAVQREALMAEMNHRIQNMFSIVQSVACHTALAAATPAEFHDSLAARLVPLARSHDLLVSGGAEAHLQNLLEDALAYHSLEPAQATLGGPLVPLTANMVMVLTLVFDELVVNAKRYGALSVPDGFVLVEWSFGAGGSAAVELLWREIGGPPVAVPTRRGFGSNLLGGGFNQFGSRVQLDFPPDGLTCRIVFPVGAAQGSAPHPRGDA